MSLRALTVLFAGLAGLAACSRAPKGPARRVILVTCDTLRADHLGCYGYDLPTSPAVDRLAKSATLYESAWSTTSVTAPAIASLLTGLLPDEIGVSAGNRSLLPSKVDTLSEILAREGIPSAAVVSNWVLQRAPEKWAEHGLAQGFGHYDDTMTHREAHREFYERTGEETTDAAIAWLSRAATNDDPFFLWVHYQDPHGPYTPPAGYAERFERPASAPEAELEFSDVPRVRGAIPSYQRLGDERRPAAYRARYDGEIAAFDAAFGRLLGWLEERRLLDGALLVFTADHGESLGERDFWFCHEQHLHAEQSRVPLVVRFPDGRPAERRAGPVGHLDFFPTALAAFGLPSRTTHGRSLFDAPVPGETRLLPQTLRAFGDPSRCFGLVSGNLHLVGDPGEPPHLYDIATDPREMFDLAGRDPEILRALLERARPLTTPPKDAPSGPSRRGFAADKALRSLGYTDGEEPR